jgi:tetratricopeptide (TPR) repeat protein
VTGRRARVVSACALVGGLVAAAGVLHAGDVRYPATPESERLLYVRSPSAARRLALSFKGLAADVYWIRTIQHFGRDLRSNRVTGRFELLQPLLDLTTGLDPHFTVVYRFGAVFLALPPPSGPGRVDQAVALLEKGLQASPNRWQYAYDVGFVYYLYARDYRMAGTWFTRAAAMPGAPDWIQPLAAETVARGGDRAGARRLLGDLLTSDQEYLRQDARRGLAQIDALEAIDHLQQVVEDYHRVEHAYPSSWSDLVRTGRLPGIPADGARVPFRYDPAAHLVQIDSRSPLAPLPTALGH